MPDLTFLLNTHPTNDQLPSNHPNLSDPVDGFAVASVPDTHWRTHPHLHPSNYALWGFKPALLPFELSPKARPRNRIKRWPFAPFTLTAQLQACGEGVPIFASFAVRDDGAAVLPACFYHRVSGGPRSCPHKDRVVPIKGIRVSQRLNFG